MEDGKVSPPDGLGDLHVGVELGAHPLGEEVGAFGNLTHEKLNDDEEALSGDAEAQPSVGRRLAQALGEIGEGRGVLESEGLNATGVVQVAA